MILVMLGTQNNSFERLLKKMDELIEKKVIDEKVIVQSGYTNYESKNMRIFDLIPQEELERYQEQADLIITHGGVGSIVSSIKKGKKVIVCSRLQKYGEHVDDHQKQLTTVFKEKGYILELEENDNLDSLLKQATKFKPNKFISNKDNFIKQLKDEIG